MRSGQLNLEREHYNICDMVREVIERMKHQFTGSGSLVPQFTHCENAEGDWDRLRMEQVLTNLLTNAIRYGNKNSIHVSVVSDNDTVQIIVQDHGIGISEVAKEIIFDCFERDVNAKEVSGLGLGLFIAKQIVTAHGGKIRVESELGKGSTFVIELPKNKPASSNDL